MDARRAAELEPVLAQAPQVRAINGQFAPDHVCPSVCRRGKRAWLARSAQALSPPKHLRAGSGA
jgi:hypothetical protein